MATRLRSVPDPLDGFSLPGWLYWNADFFAAEQRAFLRAAPQIVCHENEIAAAGEWRRAHQPTRLLHWARRYHAWKRG